MEISNSYIETLIRDSEKIRIIESMLEMEAYVDSKTLSAIVGRNIQESEKKVGIPF